MFQLCYAGHFEAMPGEADKNSLLCRACILWRGALLCSSWRSAGGASADGPSACCMLQLRSRQRDWRCLHSQVSSKLLGRANTSRTEMVEIDVCTRRRAQNCV